MNWIRAVVSAIDTINEKLGYAVSWVSLLMVVVVMTDVVMRYVFRISFVFMQELEWHLFGILFLMGAGYTLLKEGHVRVDIFYQNFSAKGKAWVDLICTLLFLFPGCYLVISSSLPFLMNSWAVKEASPDPGGIPARYLLKAVIPLGFSFIALQGISMTLKNLMLVLGHPVEARKGERS